MAKGVTRFFSGYWQSYFLYFRDLWRHGRLLKLADHFGGALTGRGNPDLASQVSVMLRRYRARSKPALQINAQWCGQKYGSTSGRDSRFGPTRTSGLRDSKDVPTLPAQVGR